MIDRSSLRPGIIKVSTYTHLLLKPRQWLEFPMKIPHGHPDPGLRIIARGIIGYKDQHKNCNGGVPRGCKLSLGQAEINNCVSGLAFCYNTDPRLSQVQSYARIETLITRVVFASENWMNANCYLGLTYIRLTKGFATLLSCYINLGVHRYFSCPDLEPIVPTAPRTYDSSLEIASCIYHLCMNVGQIPTLTICPQLSLGKHLTCEPRFPFCSSFTFAKLHLLCYKDKLSDYILTVPYTCFTYQDLGVHGTVAYFGIGSLVVYETISPHLKGYRSRIKANRLNGGPNQLLDNQIELSPGLPSLLPRARRMPKKFIQGKMKSILSLKVLLKSMKNYCERRTESGENSTTSARRIEDPD
ncbi:hypothetical protein VNO77_23201 [Canavalia gladiata]|uniref:Uncharacterized protein n=1 Tax=Canavalia gladiata TaxID=3824 RepID=A0AAN9L4W2_CANGL